MMLFYNSQFILYHLFTINSNAKNVTPLYLSPTKVDLYDTNNVRMKILQLTQLDIHILYHTQTKHYASFPLHFPYFNFAKLLPSHIIVITPKQPKKKDAPQSSVSVE